VVGQSAISLIDSSSSDRPKIVKDLVKRFPAFLHYSSKWTTSPEGDPATVLEPILETPGWDPPLSAGVEGEAAPALFGLLL
jgi:hypothetical protein